MFLREMFPCVRPPSAFLTPFSIGVVDIPLSRFRFLISRVVKIAVLAFQPVCAGNSLSLVFLVLELEGDTGDKTTDQRDIPDHVGLCLAYKVGGRSRKEGCLERWCLSS